MTESDFKEICLCGETTRVQFKSEFTSQKEMAKEMIAFANSRGGMILFGVEDKTGELMGLSYEESANQFKTIVWRTDQKKDLTVQKNETTTQNTTQKSEITTQKDLTTTQKEVLEFFCIFRPIPVHIPRRLQASLEA